MESSSICFGQAPQRRSRDIWLCLNEKFKKVADVESSATDCEFHKITVKMPFRARGSSLQRSSVKAIADAWWMVGLLTLMFLLRNVSSLNRTDPQNEKNLLALIISPTYAKEFRPPQVNNGPVKVQISTFITDIDSVNAKDMDIRFDMFMRQTWYDPRITVPENIMEPHNDHVVLPPRFADKLWVPDPIIVNAKKSSSSGASVGAKKFNPMEDWEPAPNVPHPPDSYFYSQDVEDNDDVVISEMKLKYGSLMLFKDKRITYTIKLSALLSCQMDFRNFPMDIQHCPMHIESFAHNENQVMLQWEVFEERHCHVQLNVPDTAEPLEEIAESEEEEDDSDNSGKYEVSDHCQPAALTRDLKLLQFTVKLPVAYTNDTTVRSYARGTGKFSRLVLTFRFDRMITHHIIQTFVPSVFIVCLAWFSFFMGLDSIPGRVTLLVTSQLTLVTMFASTGEELPPVAYLKAMDYWMLLCMLLVFLAQGEFVLAKLADAMYRYHKNAAQQLIMKGTPRRGIAREFFSMRSTKRRLLQRAEDEKFNHRCNNKVFFRDEEVMIGTSNNSPSREGSTSSKLQHGLARCPNRASSYPKFCKHQQQSSSASSGSSNGNSRRPTSGTSNPVIARIAFAAAASNGATSARASSVIIDENEFRCWGIDGDDPDEVSDALPDACCGFPGPADAGPSSGGHRGRERRRYRSQRPLHQCSSDTCLNIGRNCCESEEDVAPVSRQPRCSRCNKRPSSRALSPRSKDVLLISCFKWLKLYWYDSQGREKLLWREMDKAFRLIFPLLFVGSSLVFWSMLIQRKF